MAGTQQKHPPNVEQRLDVAIMNALAVLVRGTYSERARAEDELNHALQEWRDLRRKRGP